MSKYIEQTKISKEWNIPIITLRHWRKNGVKINDTLFSLKSRKAGKLVFINSDDWYTIPAYFRASYANKTFKNLKK